MANGSNIPVITGIIQPDTLLKVIPFVNKFARIFTSKADVNEVNMTRNLLQERDRNKHRIVFVMPANFIAAFGQQPEVQDMSQYTCPLEPLDSFDLETLDYM